MKASNPCMFCGKELRARYPYYRLLRRKSAGSAPKTVGRICGDCIEKTKKEIHSLLEAEG
jgi:hypothetical protein